MFKVMPQEWARIPQCRSLFWGLFVILFQNEGEISALDDVSEVDDDGRTTLYSVLVGVTILALLPLGGVGVDASF